MALDPVPWFVGGGAEHSPDVARMVANAANNGSGGVCGGLDFRVTSTPVPGTNVRMAAGAAFIPNGYLPAPDFGKQSYVARADSVTDLAIAATGSGSGRSDLVILRMDDPQFGGQAPANVVTGPYVRFAVISNVSSAQTTLPAGLGYPAVVLARIDLPASTGTIQQAHITDLRKIANPRRTRDLYNTQLTATTTANSATIVQIANQAARTIAVPSWATQMKVIGLLNGFRCLTGNATGGLMPEFAGSRMANTAIDMDLNTRATHVVSDTIYVPAALRNTSQLLRLVANRNAGTGTFQMDQYGMVVWDVEFLEAASTD